jgi:shikimate kinase
LITLNEVRAPLYAEVADIVIDVDDLAPDEIAERILAAVAVHAADDATKAE